MKQAKKQPIINSNVHNFTSPERYADEYVNRINPDKFTFLNSNLLVSNILNHLPSTQQDSCQKNDDAYTNQQVESQKFNQRKFKNKEKIERVNKLSKCVSQKTLQQKRKQRKQLIDQVKQIEIMQMEMHQNARDILSRRQDNTYLGRNLIQGQNYLKNMKETNPADKLKKSEATRVVMKESSKQKGRSHKLIQKQNLDGSFLNQTQNNMTSLDSSLQVSAAKQHIDQKAVQTHKQQKMSELIRNKSYDNVFKEQQRLASWQGFSQFWQRAFAKNDHASALKSPKKLAKCPKQKYVSISSQNNNVLQYTTKYGRHLSLKNYSQKFIKTACSFNLQLK